MRMPVLISLAAAATVSGVSRFSMPSSSSLPKRPHVFPGGPLGSRVRESKSGSSGRVASVKGMAGLLFLGEGKSGLM